jgi:hypothetical protein
VRFRDPILNSASREAEDRHVFFAVYHIAKNTFRESLRDPVYLLILMLAVTSPNTSR